MSVVEQPEPYPSANLAELRAQIIRLLETLVEQGKITQNERVVIEKRFALNEDARYYRLQEVGKQIGVGRERARQIQEKAIRRLRSRSPQFIDVMNMYLIHVPFPNKKYWLTSEGFIEPCPSQPLQEDADAGGRQGKLPMEQQEDAHPDGSIKAFLPKRGRMRKKDFDVHSVRAYFQQRRPDE